MANAMFKVGDTLSQVERPILKAVVIQTLRSLSGGSKSIAPAYV